MDPHPISVPAPNASNSAPRKPSDDPNQADAARTAHAHEREVALGIPDVARALGIGRPLAERLLAGGALRVHVVGHRKLVLRADLDRWLATRDAPKGGIR